MYWLTKNNGDLFPATTILIIHHANKNGGFRGTSAIRDAVDETWALQNPNSAEMIKQQKKLENRLMKDERIEKHERFISIEKSRSGRSGTKLKLGQDDLNFYIEDFTPEVDFDDTAPATVLVGFFKSLRVAHPESRTKNDLILDRLWLALLLPSRKSLQRLESQQLIVSCVPEGSRSKQYKANLACGEGGRVSPSGTYASVDNGSDGDNTPGDKPLVPI